jgi:hypothetical protein
VCCRASQWQPSYKLKGKTQPFTVSLKYWKYYHTFGISLHHPQTSPKTMGVGCQLQVHIQRLTASYMIYLLTAIEQPSGGSSTAHIYTQTVHRTTQNKQYIEQHKKVWKSAGRTPSLRVLPWHLPYN